MMRFPFIANMLFKSYSVEGMFLVYPYFSNSRLKFIYFFGINSFLILQFLLLVPLQAIQFASDLKLGHYMKVGNSIFVERDQYLLNYLRQIPPRLLFWGQLIPTIIRFAIFLVSNGLY